MDFWPSSYAKQLKQFVSMRCFWNTSFLTKKASLCKSTFLSFDSKRKNRIKAISLSKITKRSESKNRIKAISKSKFTKDSKNKKHSKNKNRGKAISKVKKRVEAGEPLSRQDNYHSKAISIKKTHIAVCL